MAVIRSRGIWMITAVGANRQRAEAIAGDGDSGTIVVKENWRAEIRAHISRVTLEANLQDLSQRLRRGGYRARPVRRVYIPKVSKPGELRPLGVPAVEDKIVQRATTSQVLWNGPTSRACVRPLTSRCVLRPSPP